MELRCCRKGGVKDEVGFDGRRTLKEMRIGFLWRWKGWKSEV